MVAILYLRFFCVCVHLLVLKLKIPYCRSFRDPDASKPPDRQGRPQQKSHDRLAPDHPHGTRRIRRETPGGQPSDDLFWTFRA